MRGQCSANSNCSRLNQFSVRLSTDFYRQAIEAHEIKLAEHRATIKVCTTELPYRLRTMSVKMIASLYTEGDIPPRGEVDTVIDKYIREYVREENGGTIEDCQMLEAHE